MVAVTTQARFRKRTQDCPVCGGNADDAHGKGVRCAGYLSSNGRYAYCTREEHAGTLAATQTAAGPAYAHLLAGVCRCGVEHGELPTTVVQRVASAAEKPRRLYPRIERTLAEGYRFVRSWDYHGADGAYVYTVARYDPSAPDGRKKYLPWQPVGKQWAMDEQGLTRVQYRLPELLAAPADVPVFIVEGEKCVEALRERGLVATCSAGGAGNWHRTPDARDALAGRTVTVLSDNDEPGRAHAESVAADIVGVAASVRVLAMPGLAEHGDVYDWLEMAGAGNTIMRLYELALTTPEYNTACPPQSPNSTPRSPLDLFGQEADGGADEEQAENARDDAALDRATRAHFAERERWRRALARVQTLNASQKLVLAEVRRRVLDWTWHAEGVRVSVSVGAIAKACGCTRSTASVALHALAERGIIDYHTEPERDEAGRRTLPPRMCSFIAWRPLLLTPADIPPVRAAPAPAPAPTPEQPDEPAQPVRNGWGGKRQGAGRPCGSCGSTHTRLQLVCEDCGTIEDMSADEEPDTPARHSPRSHLAHSAYGRPGTVPQSKSERGGTDDAATAEHRPRREAG